ncbi:chitinase 18-11 [Cordyceps militaris]|uniref:chitinase n=1 Tax=Cordyceps militaris TaxID=73501 RepID=A0A2H4SBL7_CORMI|nr:chitinase 18-11 [Cordyceps militaris]
MKISVFALLAAATTQAATTRNLMYLYEFHDLEHLPPKDITAGVTHVITAFAKSDIFNNATSADYAPFKPLSEIRALFDSDAKVCMAIGGFGDTDGFSAGAASEASRKLFAKNVANVTDTLGYDCVDVDWEYPGGNGNDYKQNPNEGKVSEIETYPLLLQEIKTALGDKELSIAVPGREGDMIAYTMDTVPDIVATVDFVNVMAYDLMNRRDNVTNHHTSVAGSLASVNAYIGRGVPADKLNLGFAFYAKNFTTMPNMTCITPTGCPTVLLEDSEGKDTNISGVATGGSPFFDDVSFSDKTFLNAFNNSQADTDLGGQWFWDASNPTYWTYDTPEFIAKKFTDIVKAKKLGGVFAWSMTLDSHDWSHMKALQAGVKTL